jgi:hypothetical protein
MSQIVTTKVGRFRAVRDGEKKSWLWECPSCKTWRGLNLDQFEGRVSVLCSAPKQYYYPVKTAPCGYHETHEFARELVVTMQARAVLGEDPFDKESEDD